VDRIIRVATQEVPVVYARVDVPYLKKEGFDRLMEKDLEVTGGRLSVVGRAESMTTYLVLICHYMALSDERKEGLVQVAVNEHSSAHIEDLEERRKAFLTQPYPEGQVPVQFRPSMEKALNQALRVAREITESELAPFVQAMRRRLHRDVRSTREYYQALKLEMEAAQARQKISDLVREERRLKIADLPREMDAKIQDLKHKYSVKVSVMGRAALRLLVPVVQVMARMEYKKAKRSISLTWNPLTQRIDPQVCEQCNRSVRHLFPLEDKSGLRLLCKSCQ